MKIHTIDLEFQGISELIASYVVETTDGLILIEPGPASTREHQVKAMEKLGFTPADVTAVFITHAHLDHCGAGGWWAAQGATLYVHPKAEKHIVDPQRLLDSARGVYGDRFDALWGEMLPAPADNVRALADGEVVTIGSVEIEAIDTPGHAFHHHAFAFNGDTLFAGDVAGACLPGSRYLSVTSAPTQFHLDSYLASISRLQKRGFGRLFLTHFGEVDQIDAHWAHYAERVSESASQVAGWLDDGADAEAVRLAYEDAEQKRATAAGVSDADWQRYQSGNNTGMCADGLRMSIERLRAGSS